MKKYSKVKFSGAKAKRPGLSTLLEFARANDTIVVWRLDRLGRSMKDLVSLVSGLEEKGIQLASLAESIDTSKSSGKLFFHIFGAIAEMGYPLDTSMHYI